MTRVSESSSFFAINNAVGKTKSRLEDLQIKGSNLKQIQKPSDDPIGNVDLLAIRSQKIDNQQFKRTIDHAKVQLSYTENAITELSDIILKAKEIAINQSSNFYDAQIRQGVAKEVKQLKLQALALANKRIGNKYIFAGHKTLTRPFDDKGNYFGDDKKTYIEISKDVFVPVNISGKDAFYHPENFKNEYVSSEKNISTNPTQESVAKRGLSSLEETNLQTQSNNQSTPVNLGESQNTQRAVVTPEKDNIINHLERLENALMTNTPEVIQGILPVLDRDLDGLIRIRAEIGSTMNTIDRSFETIENDNLVSDERQSKLLDADVTELFTDLSREQNVLNATYKASSQLMNKNLMNFIN